MRFSRLIYIIYVLCSFNGQAQNINCLHTVGCKDFKTIIDSCSNELIFDVRPTDIFKNKIIPNAIFVPSQEDLDKIADTVDYDTPILVYCTIGVRSVKACEILCEKGFTQVFNLKKGVEDWKKKGYEIVELNED